MQQIKPFLERFYPAVPFHYYTIILILFLMFTTGCVNVKPPYLGSPTVDSVKPAVIQPNNLPLEFHVTGTGFNAASLIRLSIPADPSRVIHIKPTSAADNRLTFILDEPTFAKLVERFRLQQPRLSRESAMGAETRISDQRYIQVAIENDKGSSSRRFPLGVTQAKVRIDSVGGGSSRTNEPVRVTAGTIEHIPLTITFQDARMAPSISAQVFQILKDGSRQSIPGAGGIARVPPATSDATIEIAIPDVELANDYEITFSIEDCINCFDYTLPVDIVENPEITCPSCGPLFAPSGLEIINVDTQAGTVSLRWADNSNRETGHRIFGFGGEIASAPGNEGTGVIEWSGPMAAGTNPQVTCYQVSAFNEFGELSSNQDCGFPDAPNAPDRLRVTDRERHSLSLSWIDNSTTEEVANPSPPPYSGFELGRAYCLDCPYRSATSISGHTGTGAMNFTDDGLVADKNYCYKIGATNQHGTRWSSGVCASTLYEPPGPVKPGKFSVWDKSSNSIELRWRDYAHVEDGFWVQRRYPDGERSNHAQLPENNGAGWMNWTDHGLRSGTTYCYRIKIYNEYGANFTGEKCATTLGGGPTVPDLAVDQVWIAEATTPNQKFHLMYDVCNMGGAIDTSFTDKVIQDGSLATAKSFSHGPLDAFECYRQSVEYSGVAEGCYIWEIHVDAPIEVNGQIEESSEANNLGYLQACFW